MTTANEILVDALIDINALAPGQPLSATNAIPALRKLNDLIDSLSTDKDFIYTVVEQIGQTPTNLGWTPGKFKYTIGNPVGGTFSGTLTSGLPTISGVTVPSTLVAGGDLTDLQALIPAGTTVLSFNAGANTVTMSANALASSTGIDTMTYTVPGDFKQPRPLRISSGYTRLAASGNNNLDYWFECTMSMERYNEFGLKFNPGPWPLLLAYQPTFPLGTIWIYPNPSIAGEVHLFVDLILSNFASLTANVNLPQGYTRALKRLLSLELCPAWGKTPTMELKRQGAEARAFIKRLNASPIVTLRYDSEIVRSQQNDAGWIMHGGFQ
jgi:hypothetical protein